VIVDLRRLGLLVALVGVGAVGWRMLHDDAELEARAQGIACRGRVCNSMLKKRTRDLFGWTYSFSTYGDATLVVDVTCARALWVVGDYQCEVSEVDHAADGRFQQNE